MKQMKATEVGKWRWMMWVTRNDSLRDKCRICSMVAATIINTIWESRLKPEIT